MSPTPVPDLVAVILTKDEARHIQDCIASLIWTDEVVVFDAFSGDATVPLAQEAGARVIRHPFRNYAQQRNAALEMVEARWIFFVDADERATPALAQEVRQAIRRADVNGWWVPRHNYIFGRLTLGAGWWPDYQMRLLRRGKARYEREVHEIVVLEGQAGHLKNPLIHYNYDSVAHFHAKQDRYTDYDAQVLYRQGVRPRWYTPYTQFLRHFWWRFVTLGGYRDGLHGLRLSGLMAYYEKEKYRRLRRLWALG